MACSATRLVSGGWLMLALLLSSCGDGGDSDAEKVSRFKELSADRHVNLPGLASDGDIIEYAERVCDEPTVLSERTFLELGDNPRRDAYAHVTTMDAFCPEKSRTIHEAAKSLGIDLPG